MAPAVSPSGGEGGAGRLLPPFRLLLLSALFLALVLALTLEVHHTIQRGLRLLLKVI